MMNARWRQLHPAVAVIAAAFAVRPATSSAQRVAPDSIAAIAISIRGLPDATPGRVVVRGPGGFSQAVTATTTINGLAAGSYIVSAEPVIIGGAQWNGTPQTQVVAVSADSAVHVSVTYRPAPPPLSGGMITLSIDGLPEGASGNVVLTALGGFTQPVTRTTTVLHLLPRAYAVSAAYVTWEGTTYAPTPTTQVVTIAPADSVGAAVRYAPAPAGLLAALAPGFQARAIDFKGVTFHYQIFVPHGYTPDHQWPIILFGHGSGEKGSDNKLQTGVGLGRYVQANAETFPAVVVFPQQAGGQSAADFDSMMVVMLDATMREANIDSARQYLTGVSAGGAHLWWLAYHDPTRFAALAPISGLIAPKEFGLPNQTAALAAVVPALRLLPIRQYNGTDDTQVRITTYAFPIQEAFAAAGAPNYTFIQVPGGTHGSTWDIAYADPEFWKWLFAQRR